MRHVVVRGKTDDPKRVQLRAELDQANTWLRILCKGIGRILADKYVDHEDVRPIIDRINSELLPAVEAVEACQRAFEPYRLKRWNWGKRRRVSRARTARSPKPRTKAVKSANRKGK